MIQPSLPNLPLPWHDNGVALYGPPAPDGRQYFFSDSSGMRTLAATLLRMGAMTADDAPMENAATVSPNRIEQCTVYSCLVIERANAQSQWQGYRSNLGAEHLKASGRTPHVLPIPTPAVVPQRRVLPALVRLGHGISEFIPGDTQHNGMCTQCSLETCLAAQQGRDPLPANMLAYALDMIRRGWAAPNGGTSLDHIAQYARVKNAPIAAQWDYQEPLQRDWLGLFDAQAGINPILIQVAHGANLIDAETGIRPEAAARGLRYHAIAIVGTQGDDILCCDGDHPQVTTRFQVYSRATLAAAVPCGLLMLAAK